MPMPARTPSSDVPDPIPARAGIGLRHPHHRAFVEERPPVGWIEVHSENYFGGGQPLAFLEAARAHYPLSLHGVGLSLGTDGPLDPEHLARIKALIGQRFIPGLLDRYLSRVAWDGQTTRSLPSGHPLEHPEDNVDAPLPGDRGAHGPFGHIARTSSKTFWLRSNASALFGGALALGAGLWLTRWATRHR